MFHFRSPARVAHPPPLNRVESIEVVDRGLPALGRHNVGVVGNVINVPNHGLSVQVLPSAQPNAAPDPLSALDAPREEYVRRCSSCGVREAKSWVTEF
jgi:hypothetical protein